MQKRYGQSKQEYCPFCGQLAISKSKEDVPVCSKHKDSKMNDLKCLCGGMIEPKYGKFGLYFFCFKCGNINANKIFELNTVVDSNTKKSPVDSRKPIRPTVKLDKFGQEELIRSDDPRYFD